jgi:hypothetical protein
MSKTFSDEYYDTFGKKKDKGKHKQKRKDVKAFLRNLKIDDIDNDEASDWEDKLTDE